MRRAGAITACVIALAVAPARAAQAPTLTLAPAPAAAFSARTVDGATFRLADALARGPVLIDFWATWCTPCLDELPALERLYEAERARGLGVVAISIDGPRNFSRVEPTARRLGLRFPIVIDEDGALQQKYQVSAVPTSILIASDGHIVRLRAGYLPGEDAELGAAIERLLPAAPGDSAR